MFNVQFNRRDFMKVGGISAALSSVGLTDANAANLPTSEKSVVWLWLGGGATHIETFDPKPSAPVGVRSTTGSIMTNGDFLLGGNFIKLASRSDKISVVRSFAHRNSSHRTGTHWVMTGHNSTDNTPQSMQQEPSYGSVMSSMYGANHPLNGMPTYVRVNGISFDGPAWLGGQYKPYEASGEGVQNLKSRIENNRFLERLPLGVNRQQLLDQHAATFRIEPPATAPEPIDPNPLHGASIVPVRRQPPTRCPVPQQDTIQGALGSQVRIPILQGKFRFDIECQCQQGKSS